MTRRALGALAALTALAGCGDERPPERPAAATRVTVTVRPEGDDGPARRRTVGCEDADVCRRLRRADFSAQQGTVVCTQVFGGKARARVTGRVGGRRVAASFDLHDGCAIARWDRFAWLLGPRPKS